MKTVEGYQTMSKYLKEAQIEIFNVRTQHTYSIYTFIYDEALIIIVFII
jgi:hypothetical protein